MRIGYITHANTLTGASRSLIDIIVHMGEYGNEPIVFVRQDGNLTEELDRLHIEWHRVRYAMTLSNNDGKWWRDAAKRALYWPGVSALCKQLKTLQIDVVHNNSLLYDGGMAAAKKLGLPYVCHIREFMQEDHGLQFLHESRTRTLATQSDAAIAISHAIAKKYADWFSNDKLIVLPDGLDIDTYRMDHGPLLEGPICRLLLPGRIAPGKGQLDAIRAVGVLRARGLNIALTIVGGQDKEGAYARQCISYIQEHGLESIVEMREFVNDLTELKQAADITLTCSRSEALGRVTVEGMLCGTLVIGANSGATPEIIEDSVSGLLYESGNVEDLADKIQWAIESPDVARKLAITGQRSAAEKYSVEAYNQRLASIYQEIYAQS